MSGTYTFVVPVWCVLLIVVAEAIATAATLRHTYWLRRQVKERDRG